MEQQIIGNLKWTNDTEIVIIIKDFRKVIYKNKVNINDTKGLASIFSTFEKYGISIRDLADIIEQRKQYRDETKQEDWFGYPLGDKKL